ncbi:MAG: hypothetical protein ACRD34_14100 [Bryobacteraceae bacterium]
MMWRNVVLLLVAALLWTSGAFAQSAPSKNAPAGSTEPQTKGAFFAGTVVALSGSQITVAREVAETAREQRTFRITSKTKIGKAVQVKSHVTVHYEHTRRGDIAIEIQVRPSIHTKGTP